MNFKTICLATCLFAYLPLTAREDTVVPDSLGFERALGTSPASLLRGKVSGVRVSSTDGSLNGLLNVNIRGVNSLRGDSQPLWIVDGAVINTTANSNLDAYWQWGEEGYASPLNLLSGISAYDIESIEVIKNTSATALYGAAGANGVILITTKCPSGDRISVDWHSNVGVSLPRINSGAFKPGVSHDHHISVTANKNKTKYYLSANYRNIKGVSPAESNDNIGLRLGFDSKAGDAVHFGMNTLLSLSNNSNPSAVGKFGYPSLMSTLRTITATETADGWIADYDNYSNNYRFDLSFFLDIKLAEGFYWKNTLGVDYHYLNRYFWYGNGTSFGLLNNGAASILANSIFNDRFNSSFNFERYFSKHHLAISAAFEHNALLRRHNQVPATDLFDHSLRAKGVNLSSAMVNLNRHQLDINRYAALATLDYDWNGAAGLNAVVRAEFLPKYLDAVPEVYGGVQPFIDIRKLAFNDNKVLSAFKIEGGWGTSGNFDRLPVPYGNGIEQGTEPFYEDIPSQRTTEANAGFKLGFLKDRITLKAAVYKRQTVDKDVIYCFGKNKPNKSKVGGDFMWDYDARTTYSSYSGTLENSGVEVDFAADVVRTRTVTWNISANAAYNYNRFLNVSANDVQGPDLGSGLIGNAAIVGAQVGAIYGYDRATNSFGILGNPIPLVHGGLTTTLRVGKFTADLELDGAYGFDIANLNLLLASQDAPYGMSSTCIEKGDYLRLSRFAIGYELNPKKIKWLKAVAFNLSGNNLYTFTKYSGWNPDVNVFGIHPGSAGMDYASCPSATTIIFGVNFKF